MKVKCIENITTSDNHKFIKNKTYNTFDELSCDYVFMGQDGYVFSVDKKYFTEL